MKHNASMWHGIPQMKPYEKYDESNESANRLRLRNNASEPPELAKKIASFIVSLDFMSFHRTLKNLFVIGLRPQDHLKRYNQSWYSGVEF